MGIMIHTQNDSRAEPVKATTIPRTIVGLNVIAAVISAAAAVLANVDPALLVPGDATPLVDFYAQAYLVRALPISAVLIGLLATRRPGLRPALLVAGLAQVGDIVIGALHGQPMMITGATLGAVIHLGSAWLLRRK